MLHKVMVVRVQEPPVLCNHRRTIKLFVSFRPIQHYITDSEFQFNLDLWCLIITAVDWQVMSIITSLLL